MPVRWEMMLDGLINPVIENLITDSSVGVASP